MSLSTRALALSRSLASGMKSNSDPLRSKWLTRQQRKLIAIAASSLTSDPCAVTTSAPLQTDFWTTFNAAIACALAGEPEKAQRFFESVLMLQDNSAEWVLAAQADAKELSAVAPQTEQFRHMVAERIHRTRELQRLPRVSQVDFG